MSTRRYRYPSVAGSAGKRTVIGQALKYFLAWNAFAYLAYKLMSRNARRNDPAGAEVFDKRPSSEKIMIMQGKNPDFVPIRYTISPSEVTKTVTEKDGTETAYTLTKAGFKETDVKAKVEIPVNQQSGQNEPTGWTSYFWGDQQKGKS